jgi:hypothetical protein
VGDMADDLLDQIFAGYDGRPWQRAYPPTTCKRCGSGDVYWQTVNGDYKLYSTNTLTQHVCQPERMQQQLIDDFEDLDNE